MLQLLNRQEHKFCDSNYFIMVITKRSWIRNVSFPICRPHGLKRNSKPQAYRKKLMQIDMT